MRKKLVVIAVGIAIGVSLLLPAAAFAGGDKVNNPDYWGDPNEGVDPLVYQLQVNK